MRKIFRYGKWVWYAAVALGWLYQFLGFHFSGTPMNWVVSFEVWLTNRVPDPILFAFTTGLLLSTVLLPEIWKHVRPHLSAPDNISADLVRRQIEAQEAHTEELRRQRQQRESENDPLRQALREKERQAFMPKPERLPVKDLLTSAEADGWKFQGSKNVLYHFGLALRQAAADKSVEIHGRVLKPSFSLAGSSGLGNALAPIPAEYFQEHYVSHAGLHGAWLSGGVNFQTKACDLLEKEPIQYVDLHVMKPQAWEWLRGEARKARDTAMTEEQVRQTALASQEPKDAS